MSATYDPKCRALASLFLSDYQQIEPDERERLEDRLAEAIQARIEDFLSEEVPEGKQP